MDAKYGMFPPKAIEDVCRDEISNSAERGGNPSRRAFEFESNRGDASRSGFAKVALVVLNWNDKQSTSRCLRSLRELEYPNFLVLVVDNGSTDGSVDHFQRVFPEIIVLANDRNLGCPEGFNVGIREALRRGVEYVICLNNDTFVDRMFLAELVEIGEAYTSAGALCPKEYNYFDPERLVYAGGSSGLVRRRNRGFGELDKGQYDEVSETEMLCGAAMVFRSRTLLEIGLLDAEFFFDWDDKDMAARLVRSGYKLIFVPGAKFWHKGRGATRGLKSPFRVYFSVRNGFLFAKKHYPTAKRLAFGFAFLPLSLWSAISSNRARVASIKGFVMAIIWHLNRRCLPRDDLMIEILRDRPSRSEQ